MLNRKLNRKFKDYVIIWNGESPDNIYETQQPEIIVPNELLEIAHEWRKLSDAEEDIGSCVVGARMEFIYNGIKYHMHPQSKWQGERSWIKHKDLIISKLKEIGAEKIYYNYGMMD